MSSDINVQTFSGKVNITSNLLVGSSHLFVDTINNRVGLITNTPAAGLHVESNAYVHTNFRVGSDIEMNVTAGRITAGSFEGDGSAMTGINSDSGSWVNGTDVVYLSTTGDKVGIGTTSPTATLELFKGFTATGLYDTATLKFSTTNITSNWDVGSIRGAVKLNAGGTSGYPGGLVFATKSPSVGAAGGLTDKMVIDANGNVGIGTTSPSSKLTINTEPSHDDSFDFSDIPLQVNYNTTVTSNSNLNDPKSVMILTRQGTSGQAYAAGAAFRLSRWEDSNDGTAASRSRLDIALTDASFDLTNIMTIRSNGTVTAATFSGALSGNASTATTAGSAGSATTAGSAGSATTAGSAATLSTARHIGGVSFDGSAAIDLPGVNTAGNQNTTGTSGGITFTELDVTAPNVTSGTWHDGTNAYTWGVPKFNNTYNNYAHNTTTGHRQWNIPTGMKSAYISHLQWSSSGYADIYGVRSDGALVFLKRINTLQAVENTNHSGDHDGSTITFIGSGLDSFSSIRITNRAGTIHLTGLAFTPTLDGTEGTGMVHPQQLSTTLSANQIPTLNQNTTGTATTATNQSGGTVSATTITSSGIITCNGNKMVITGGHPTLYLRDSDSRTGMIHQNSNIMYFLSGAANSDTWATTANSMWPLEINCTNNNATFGGSITTASSGSISCGYLYVSQQGSFSNGCRIYGTEHSQDYPHAQNDYFTNGGNIQGDSPFLNFSLYVENTIRAAGIVVLSDRRIKSNIVDIHDTTALDQIRLLKPKYYEYVDKVSKGTLSVIGFIAQEVKEVLPRAVSVADGDIPNIYETATISSSNTVTFTNFNTSDLDGLGKLIAYLAEDKREELTITEVVDEHTVRVEEDMSEWGSKLFVWGQKVPDFHHLNKDYIFTVATAALQEVDRQLQAEKTENEITRLKLANAESRISILEQSISSILSKLNV